MTKVKLLIIKWIIIHIEEENGQIIISQIKKEVIIFILLINFKNRIKKIIKEISTIKEEKD